LTADYGFNMKENLMIRLNNTSAPTLKAELLRYPNIRNASAVSHVPASGISYGNGFKKDIAEKDWLNIHYFVVDEDYLQNMEIQTVAGKFFQAANGASNKNFVVLNEEAVKVLNYKHPADALGEELIYQPDSARKVIIGVVRNYNHSALMSKIEPMALLYDPEQVNIVQVRYEGDYAEAAQVVEKAWAKVNPALRSDYKTVEEEIKYFYSTIFGDVVNIVGVIAGLAILISCLGLLGMATYTIETRKKEISIRKVLGSSNRALVLLLSKGFLMILIIAATIGIPLAFLLNNFWLQFMAYRTSVGLGTIATGVLLLTALGAATIGSQTLRAAYTNPAENLKNE
ncbi:MAG TPA: FtsX-like permease family protein, partial [Chryseosolibacter sp.]|nr:FtsX-like permease family protein [Chryseosolibacter sp.]